MDSNAGGYIVSNFKNTGNVKFIKPVSVHGGSTLRSRTPMINRAATSKFPAKIAFSISYLIL